MNKIFSIFILVLILVLSGCEAAPVESTLPVMETIDENDLITSLNMSERLDKNMNLITVYHTGAYNLGTWRITDNKVIEMTAQIDEVPEGVEVFLEHVHIDVTIKSKQAAFDGWLQDSMDDSYHGTSQDGFWVSGPYPYHNIFSIQGFSEKLLLLWNGYGTETRLTEGNLLSHEVYGNKIVAVYDFLIKYPGEEYFHTVSVKNEFLIPVKRKLDN